MRSSGDQDLFLRCKAIGSRPNDSSKRPSPFTPPPSPLTPSPHHPFPTRVIQRPHLASSDAVRSRGAASTQRLRNFWTSEIAEPWAPRFARTGCSQEQSPLSSSLCLSLKNDDGGMKRESSSTGSKVLKSLKNPKSVGSSLGRRSKDDLPLHIRLSHL